MTNQGDGVGEGGQPFGIPGGRAQRKSLVSRQQMRCQGQGMEKRPKRTGVVRAMALVTTTGQLGFD